MKKIELLSPAKDFEHGSAAILAGADALYIGAPKFGARAAAAVAVEQIEKLCGFAHRFDAKVYVAMNTLIFESELVEAEQMAKQMWSVGADALIVQDMAFLSMNLPPIELHASTQAFNIDPLRVKFLSEVGFTRVILERALDIEQIREISAKTKAELECFIHGSICVSYSGRCYMSRTTSNRSGNRGVCSQSCRLPYNLLDEDMKPMMKNQHLLSLQDMNMTESIENMIDAGVTSLKIEGRLKDMNYVRNVVGWYRRELDRIIDGRSDLERTSKGVSSFDFTPDPIKSFARGATSYFINGNCDDVASFDTPKSLGEPIGAVMNVKRDFFEINSDVTLSSGDGICFMGESGKLEGTNINRVEGNKIYPNRMDGITRGVDIFRNFDHQFNSLLIKSRPKRLIEIEAKVEIEATKIKLSLRVEDIEVESTKDGLFDLAQNVEKANDNLRKQILKMGDTIFTLSDVELIWDEPRFVPISLINELRRDVVELLYAKIDSSYVRRERRVSIGDTKYPISILTGEDNVTNSLARKFYLSHGVTEISDGYDIVEDLTGCRVMQMRYCLRREMGECLKEDTSYTGKLFIENGLKVYELQFDCAKCAMSVVYRGERERVGIATNRDSVD